MISQPSAPTGVLGLRQSPDTVPGWGVSGAQFSELHQRDPSELLLAAGMMVIYLPVQLGFVSKSISFPGMDKDRGKQGEEGLACARLPLSAMSLKENRVPHIYEHLSHSRGAERSLVLQPVHLQPSRTPCSKAGPRPVWGE